MRLPDLAAKPPQPFGGKMTYIARPMPPMDPSIDVSNNHYWTYHSLPVLLACKKPVTASVDEDLFIAVHQVCELSFHQMIIDLDRTLDLARAGIDPGTGAIALTSRISVEMVQKSVMAGCPVLLVETGYNEGEPVSTLAS
jgi:hypothetical protein